MRERDSRVIRGLGELPRPFDSGCGAEDEPEVDLVAEALARGRTEGLAQGREKALAIHQEELQQVTVRLGKTLEELSALTETRNREHQGLMIDLALEAASKIVRRTIDAGDPVAARALEEALEALPSGQTLKARIHPSDLASIETELSSKIASQQIELRTDEAISRGGCIVESGSGTIDATIETAAEAVRAQAEGRPEAP